MPSCVRPYALSLSAVFLTLALAGPPPARAADGCSAADFRLARGFDAGGALTARSYAAVDLNNDGRPDLVAADFESGGGGVLLNDGTGWLGEPRRFGVQGNPSALAVADFNADGRADLAVTTSQRNFLMRGDGAGGFTRTRGYLTADFPNSIALADFDGDGDTDIAAGDSLLRRNPDDPQDTNFGEWRFWLDKLEVHHGNFVPAEMVRAFISSIEYRQRFGQ